MHFNYYFACCWFRLLPYNFSSCLMRNCTKSGHVRAASTANLYVIFQATAVIVETFTYTAQLDSLPISKLYSYDASPISSL